MAHSLRRYVLSRKNSRSFHVVPKLIGSICSLNCSYCYYRYKDVGNGRISDDLLDKFICQYIAGQEDDPVVFDWHGGEPALLGLDFFRKVVALEQKCAGQHCIENDFRHASCYWTKRGASSFKEHRFYVGLSIDGPKHLHDQFRRLNGGAPSFDRVYRAARLLQEYDNRPDGLFAGEEPRPGRA